jgi:hypothetical protein
MAKDLDIKLLEEEFRGETWRVAQVRGELRAFNLDRLAATLDHETSVASCILGRR